MQNQYEAPNVIPIGQAQSLIRGSKWQGFFDFYTNCEASYVVDIWYDIDE